MIELLTSGRRSGERLEFQYANGPSSSTRKINSMPARIGAELLRPRLGVADDGCVLPCVGSESGRVLADRWALKRTPENLPLQQQQYLARSLFAVWQESQYFVIPRACGRTS